MPDRIRVFTCDDYPLILEGVRAILAKHADIELVGEAGSAEDSLPYIAELLPDVVLMDVALPGIDGIIATRQIKATCPSIAIIALTRYDDVDHILQLYRSGASAYLVKDVGPDQLIETIRTVASGAVVVHPRVAERVVGSFEEDPTVRETSALGRRGLTEREVQVLRLVAQGMPNKGIASILSISVRTVENHLANILRKLNVNFRMQAALYAIREGLASEIEPEGIDSPLLARLPSRHVDSA